LFDNCLKYNITAFISYDFDQNKAEKFDERDLSKGKHAKTKGELEKEDILQQI
jgi:hypothetical protein